MSKLGDTLRERRVALGVSLEQAEAATRIRLRLLDALENGDWNILPNPGYVRGYISSYARYLELDPMPLLNMYKAETGAVRFHELNLPQIDEAVAPTGQQHAVPLRAAVAVVLVIALISMAVWGVVRIWQGPEEPPPVPAPVTETSSTPTAEETTAPQVNATPKPAVTQQPFTLRIEIDQDGASWLLVKVDGQQAYVGTLAGGQSKEFEVARAATVEVGKPEAVTITRDGTPVTLKGTKITLKASAAQ